MKRAVLFPGQGTGFGPVLAPWMEASAEVSRLVDLAAGELEMETGDLLAGGGSLLEGPAVLQPVLTALSLGIHAEVVGAGIEVHVAAGHSLGELAAIAAAGACSSEAAVGLAGHRGRLMADQATVRPGGMVALTDADRETADRAITTGRREGVMDLAARNAPREWVLTGDQAAVEKVLTGFSSRRLDVAGPWHASTMAPAAESFAGVLRSVPFAVPRMVWVGNRRGEAVDDPGRMAEELAGQLVQPIAWNRVMETLDGLGVEEYLVVGPGKVLRGLVRANLGRDVRVRLIQFPESLSTRQEATRS